MDRARAGVRHRRARAATLTSAGIVPTPAVAYLTPRMGYTAGVVISASHNPFEDNGIKVFSGAGEKFTEALERQVEAIVADPSWTVGRRRTTSASSRSTIAPSTSTHLAGDPARRRRGTRHAHRRSTAPTARRRRWRRGCFEELGFDTLVIGSEPDGRNINLGCGSTAPRARWRRTVVERRLRARHRLRRRRRSRDLRRRERQGRGRRRGDADVRQADEGRGPAEGQRRRRDGDEQHRPGDRAARGRHRPGALPGGRQVRDGGDAAPRPRRSAASSRATSSSRTICSPATAWPRR